MLPLAHFIPSPTYISFKSPELPYIQQLKAMEREKKTSLYLNWADLVGMLCEVAIYALLLVIRITLIVDLINIADYSFPLTLFIWQPLHTSL